MRHGRLLPNLPRWSRALLLVVLPVACATGTEPSPDSLPMADSTAGTTTDEGGSAGTETGGTPGSAGTLPIAGTTVSTAGTGSSTAGTGSGQGGKGGTGSGGAATAGSGGKGGTATGGSGTAGSTAGSGGKGGTGTGGASGGSGGSGGSGDACGCVGAPKAWVDNSVLSFKTGDCLTTAGKTYRYTGVKAQTYANGSCNPAKQEMWCTDAMSNDYNFMLCP